MTTCIGTNRRSRSFSFWQLTHLIWARIGQIEWCSENWDYFLQIVSLNPPLHWKPSGECTDCPSQGNQDTNADKNWKLVDTCFVSLALRSGSMDLGGLAKHANVTHPYLIAHKNLFTEKERQTMMNVFVKSGRIALFKLISTLFHCDPDCESHNKVRMRYKK